MGVLVPLFFYVVAFFCTIAAIALAVLHIYRHLLNYTEPTYQRFIVRIIFMVPVYALMSFLSLIVPESSIYFNSIREVQIVTYEDSEAVLVFLFRNPFEVAILNYLVIAVIAVAAVLAYAVTRVGREYPPFPV
ncbi:Organic solute transporter Ost-alpha [Spatholobus suberectus]|nr:Organic solute transporter Ost-alpha [Spatholobus suberectus]